MKHCNKCGKHIQDHFETCSCCLAKPPLAPPSGSAIDLSKLTEHDWLQVDLAARGCVSGRLHEWPHLAAAFKRAGLEAQPSTGSFAVRDISRLLLMLSPNK